MECAAEGRGGVARARLGITIAYIEEAENVAEDDAETASENIEGQATTEATWKESIRAAMLSDPSESTLLNIINGCRRVVCNVLDHTQREKFEDLTADAVVGVYSYRHRCQQLEVSAPAAWGTIQVLGTRTRTIL